MWVCELNIKKFHLRFKKKKNTHTHRHKVTPLWIVLRILKSAWMWKSTSLRLFLRVCVCVFACVFWRALCCLEFCFCVYLAKALWWLHFCVVVEALCCGQFCVCTYELKALRCLEFCVCVCGNLFAAFIVACLCVCGKDFSCPHLRLCMSMWKSSLLPSVLRECGYGKARWCLYVRLCMDVETFFAVFIIVCVCVCVCGKDLCFLQFG